MVLDYSKRPQAGRRRVCNIFSTNSKIIEASNGTRQFYNFMMMFQREKPGKVCKIRGQAYVTKVTPSLAYRMIDSAKKTLHGYISDVYITVDQRKGDAGGKFVSCFIL